MRDIFIALMRLRPNCEYSWIGNDLKDIVWINPSNTITPTLEEINLEIKKMQAEELARPKAKQDLLNKLGITEDEARLLLS